MKHALTQLTIAAAAVIGNASWAQSTPPNDIEVSFTGPAEVQIGRADHFRLKVKNIGANPAASVSTTLIFPPGVELDTKLNTATGKYVPKVPTNCSYSVTPVKKLTCLANNVATTSDDRNFVIDLRVPLTGSAVTTFTWTATAAGDTNLNNNTASWDTVYGSFLPNNGLDFSQNPTLWSWGIAGRKNVLDSPMTGRPNQIALDANGEGSGMSGSVPVTWKATKVGTGLNVKVHTSMYSPAIDMNLTPFSSRCFQGMAYWTGLQDTGEVRMCY
jgi:hypothetical protein